MKISRSKSHRKSVSPRPSGIGESRAFPADPPIRREHFGDVFDLLKIAIYDGRQYTKRTLSALSVLIL